MLNKDQLMIAALKENLGKIVVEYEGQLAELRADATVRFQRQEEELARLRKENDELHELLEKAGVPERMEPNVLE